MQAMRFRAVSLIAFAVLLLFSACSQEPELVLSPAAAEGREIAKENGCSSCHGDRGQGVTAPSWQNIYMKQIPINGGATVLADEDYLYRSITDPQAEIVRDWTLKMPRNDLNDDQIASVIAYIKELS